MRSTLLLFSILIFCNCSGDSDKKTTPLKESAVQETFAAGKLLQVTEQKDSLRSYCLFLPSGFDLQKKYPLLFLLDPQGKGEIPVELYKNIAENYGFILAASNNCKNGLSWSQSSDIVESALSDISRRLPINGSRIYLGGFSGGSRIANAYTLFNGNINGVICCGAVLPSKIPGSIRNYALISLSGTHDFNFIEMQRYELVDLAGYDIKHILVTFEGKHEWPVADVFEETWWWMELNEMRKDPKLLKIDMINKKLAEAQKEAEELVAKGEKYALYKLCKKTINFYERLAELSIFYGNWKKLKADPQVDIALRQEEEIIQKEENYRHQLLNAVEKENFSWWQKEVSSIRKKSRSDSDSKIRDMNFRILEYMSVASYMQATAALLRSDLKSASHYVDLYLLVDPDNKEAHYLEACILALKKRPEEALRHLKLSIDNGFDDKERIQKEEAFNFLRAEESFQKTIVLIR